MQSSQSISCDVLVAPRRAPGATAHSMRARCACLYVAMVLLTSGCGVLHRRADDVAAAAGFVRTMVEGTRFTHVAYSADGGSGQSPVWIYIEGDGVPWVDVTLPSRDPTPRTLVALELMKAGPRPAAYLGRPCYFGTAGAAPCEPVWWTHRRFDAEVVASMVAALRRLVEVNGWSGRTLNLAGFSGGGTLATLMVPRLTGVCALITIASPLDTDEWTASRGFSALAGSENPARMLPLNGDVGQLHLRGGQDRIVASNNGSEFLRKNPAAKFELVAGIDHGLAWAGIWPSLLQKSVKEAIGNCN